MAQLAAQAAQRDVHGRGVVREVVVDLHAGRFAAQFQPAPHVLRLGFGVKHFLLGRFQILTQLDLLPRGSLVHNESGRFICKWAGLKKNAESPYLSELPDEFELPVAHAEGRFVGVADDAKTYVANGRAALLYTSDINGSSSRIAGLQDDTGRVFGLMPHPERFVTKSTHYDPDWNGAERGWGFYMFKSVRNAMAA